MPLWHVYDSGLSIWTSMAGATILTGSALADNHERWVREVWDSCSTWGLIACICELLLCADGAVKQIHFGHANLLLGFMSHMLYSTLSMSIMCYRAFGEPICVNNVLSRLWRHNFGA